MSLRQYRGSLPEHVALLTTAHRHPVHLEFGDDTTRYWKELWATDDVFYFTVAGGSKHVRVFYVRPSAIIAPISLGVGLHPRARIWAERSSMRSQKPGGNWPWSSLESMVVILPTARPRLVAVGAIARLASTRFGHIYGVLACAVVLGAVIR